MMWNDPIPANATLSPQSGSIARALDKSPFGIQLNRDGWTSTVVYADSNTPRYTVSQKKGGWHMSDVPIPSNAHGTHDSDSTLVIIDKEEGKAWSFYGAGENFASTHQARNFGVFDLDGSGWWQPSGSDWTGRSSNSSYLAGLILPEELKAGHIDHALAVGIDRSLMANKPVLPALTTDTTGGTGNIPNGTHLQLDPDLDLSRLGLGREGKIVAEALQKYGAFVTERTSGFAMYFQSKHNLPTDPYKGMDFSGLDADIHSHWRVIAPAAAESYETADKHPEMYWSL